MTSPSHGRVILASCRPRCRPVSASPTSYDVCRWEHIPRCSPISTTPTPRRPGARPLGRPGGAAQLPGPGRLRRPPGTSTRSAQPIVVVVRSGWQSPDRLSRSASSGSGTTTSRPASRRFSRALPHVAAAPDPAPARRPGTTPTCSRPSRATPRCSLPRRHHEHGAAAQRELRPRGARALHHGPRRWLHAGRRRRRVARVHRMDVNIPGRREPGRNSARGTRSSWRVVTTPA